MERLLTFICLFVLNISLSHAAVIINIVESGGDVVATATGTINTAGLTPTALGSTIAYEGIFRGSLGFAALDGSIFVGQGGGSVDEYVIETTHAFSTGPLWVSQASTGNHVGIISRSDMGDSITLPSGYSSDEPISGTSTWPGATLAAMGAIPGTYVFSWSGDSLTLNIGGPAPPTTYTVGGTISGLTGSVTLQNSGGDNLVRSANGDFTFGTALTTGSTYVVTVLAQPTGQTCGVNNGSGTIVSSNVSNVSVSCATDPVTEPVITEPLPLPGGGLGTISFTTSDPGCAFASAEFVDAIAPPEGTEFPHGVANFTVSGCADGAQIDVTLDYGTTLAPGSTAWKSDPWREIAGATVGDSTISYSVTDGGENDADEPVNGTIVDPAGAGSPIALDPQPSATPVPVTPLWALWLMAGLLALYGTRKLVAR